MTTTCLEISVPATLVNVRRVRRRVAELAADAGAPEHVVDDVRLCVSEAVANAVVHGYDRDQRGEITVSVSVRGDELTVVVFDDGKGLTDFKRDGDLGYGLRVIEKLTRRCLVSSAPNAGTEVHMTFPLAATGAAQPA
jgi:stage II sporulation protein AB (anti-sigma F factor)